MAYMTMVPTSTGKPGKMAKHFPIREKSGNFTQNTGKMKGILPQKLEKLGNFSQFLFLFLSDF